MWAKTLVFVGIKRIKKDLMAIVSSHCLLDGGARETRTIAPVTRSPSLAGTPLHHLGYCSNGYVIVT